MTWTNIPLLCLDQTWMKKKKDQWTTDMWTRLKDSLDIYKNKFYI